MRVIDSHTEGEPTRVVIDGLPDLGKGSMAERRTQWLGCLSHTSIATAALGFC